MAPTELVRHAPNPSGPHDYLCGGDRENGRDRLTRPHESVNCPDCRVTINAIRKTYPEHAGYTDWRQTKGQLRQAAADMAADMMGGAND